MSFEEPVSKRQRTSLSPASPPMHLAGQAIRPDPKSPQVPRTPISPSRMSTNNDAGSTSVGNDSQQTEVAAQDTPVSMSVSRDIGQEGESEAQDALRTEEAADHRRTDHERNEKPEASNAEGLPFICVTSHEPSQPHPSQDLISLYSLTPIASSVARRDPATGAKINKLRKSYEGKVKTLGLPGRNKPTTIPGELLGFTEWSDEAWFDQRIYGKELDRALDEGSNVMKKLGRALEFGVGRLPKPEHERWKASLGLDDPAPQQQTPQMQQQGGGGGSRPAPPVKHPTAAATQMLRANNPSMTSMRSSAPASPNGVARPERTGKKRSYRDASFEGYAESGFNNDEESLSMDERRGSLGGRKRRKDFEDRVAPASGNMLGVGTTS